MPETVTIVIVAHNAEKFIHRAIKSALDQNAKCVLLVDDYSTDNTLGVAKSYDCDSLKIVTPKKHKGVGNARGFALGLVSTPYVAWLDADDAYVLGRVSEMLSFLQKERFDVVYDSAKLYCGQSLRFVKDLTLPDFLIKNSSLSYRLLERCYIPGPGWMLMKTDLAKTIGYDPMFTHAEDFDFLVRMVMSYAKIGFMDYEGYLQYAYEGSLSRNIVKQKYFCGYSLSKYSYQAYENLYFKNHASTLVTYIAMVYIASYKGDWNEVLLYLKKIKNAGVEGDIVENLGPFCRKLGWYYYFFRGNYDYQNGAINDAIKSYEKAQEYAYTAEVCNNLGVSYRKLGMGDIRVIKMFEQALSLYPNCYDSIRNLKDETSLYLTTHPLRSHPFRDQYKNKSDGFVFAN